MGFFSPISRQFSNVKISDTNMEPILSNALYRRAVKKEADEKLAIKHKEAEIERLEAENIELDAERSRFVKRLAKYMSV